MQAEEKMQMLAAFRKKQNVSQEESDVSQEESKVHSELLYEKEAKDYRSPKFEEKLDEQKKNAMKTKAFFIFLISAVTVSILAILCFVIGEALPIEWLIVNTVILTGAVVWVLKRYYIDPLIIDYTQYTEPW